MDPDNPAVIGGLARAMIAGGQTDEARALLDSVGEEEAKHPAIARARAALEVAAAPAADVSAEEARLAANPDDHEARFAIAQARMAAGDRDAPPMRCWRSLPATGNGTRARRAPRFLQMLEAAGPRGPMGAGAAAAAVGAAVHMMALP